MNGHVARNHGMLVVVRCHSLHLSLKQGMIIFLSGDHKIIYSFKIYLKLILFTCTYLFLILDVLAGYEHVVTAHSIRAEVVPVTGPAYRAHPPAPHPRAQILI